MKLFLEEEKEIDKVKTIVQIKEVTSMTAAIKDKTANKCFLHTCYHDKPDKNGSCKPCIREAI